MFEDAQAEVEDLRGKVQDNSNNPEIAMLEQELNDALNEIDVLREQLAQQPKGGADPSQEIADLQNALEDANEEIADLKARQQSNSTPAHTPPPPASSTDSARLEELEFQLEEAKYDIEDLTAKLDESNAVVQELERLLDEEQARTDTFDATNKSLTAEITTLHERLTRQLELSKADGDTKAVVDAFEGDIAKLRAEVEAHKEAYASLESQFNESEEVNKELNQSLDAAEQEIETLNKELDEMFEANQKNLANGGGAELGELQAKLEDMEKELALKNGELDGAVEARMKDKLDEMAAIENELQDRITQLEEQARVGTQSLVQQLQDQELDAKEMRETLVSRLRAQETEATSLREDIVKLKGELSDVTSRFTVSQNEFEDYRLRSQGMEKRYLERNNLLEDLFEQTCNDVESLRAKLVDSYTTQGLEVPVFKPIPQLPPANFEAPLSPTPGASGEKKTFLSTVFGRRPSEKNGAFNAVKDAPPAAAGAAAQVGEDGQQTPQQQPKSQSTGILRSLWGNKNPDRPSPVASPTPGTVVSPTEAKALIVGADDDDVPKEPPSTFLASIWGAKSNLKRTNSETKLNP
ncbi:hypothetical protein BDR26DRAFT_140175 [Obelidium mucronatum]|nr:hypothetical protein BDR26DRAFT_140175 [Obelidium mucronatum]